MATNTSVVLRVEQDGTAAAGNPFIPYCSVTTAQQCPGGGGCPGGETCITQVARYYAYGVRNSFGMTLDPVTGMLWDTENGPGNYDEVNLIAPGFNSGWNPIMGPDALDPQGLANLFTCRGPGVPTAIRSFPGRHQCTDGDHLPNGSALGAAYDDVASSAMPITVHDRFPLNGTRTAFDLSAFPDLRIWWLRRV